MSRSEFDVDKVVIWGASGHALVVADILRLMGNYAIVGYLDSINPERSGEPFGKAEILGGDEKLEEIINGGVSHLALGVGDCQARIRLADTAVKFGFNLATAIHPSAIISSSVQIGGGSVLCAGSIVNPEARIGRAAIVNSGASIDHECVIEDGVHLAPGVHLAGMVTVGMGTFLGVGSVVRDGINVGERCTIGAGSVVVDDLPSDVLAYGVPAKVKGTTKNWTEQV